MGRKRMAETTSNEGKTANDFSETTVAILGKYSHSSSANPSEAVKAVNAGNDGHSTSNGISAKKGKTQAMDVVVRRSCRIMSSVPRAERLQMKPTLGHINIFESQAEEIPIVRQVNTGPVLNKRVVVEEIPHAQPVVTAPILNQKAMEEEIPHVPRGVGTMSIVNDKSLVDKFEFLIKVFGEYVSKTDKQVDKASNEDSSTHLNYKSLYVDSQKKVEGLMEENFHISQKLEFALGKIEAYEKMMGVMCASKEVVLFPTSSPLKKHAPVAVVGHETPSPKPKKPKKEPKKPKKEPKKPLRTYKKKNAVSFY